MMAKSEDKLRAPEADRGPSEQDLTEEMIQTVGKFVADQTSLGDLKIVSRALKELRYAFKVFAPYRSLRKVSIFGSSRVPEGNPYYALAVTLGRRLADAGFMIITGAGEGIMQAGNEGAGTERSFGVNIRLPFAQTPNRFMHDDPKLITFRFFFTRKLIFVKEAHAFVFFPGGFGTHDEAIEVLTLVQTGKTQVVPIIFMDLPDQDYWCDWEKFVQRRMLKPGYISQQDLGLFKIMSDPEAAVREIKSFYRKYHSYRFVKEHLIMRLTEPPSASLIEGLNSDFRDILTGGEIVQTEPLPEEMDDPDSLHLHRLLVPFNRRDFGRLRQLIDAVNAEG